MNAMSTGGSEKRNLANRIVDTLLIHRESRHPTKKETGERDGRAIEI